MKRTIVSERYEIIEIRQTRFSRHTYPACNKIFLFLPKPFIHEHRRVVRRLEIR